METAQRKAHSAGQNFDPTAEDRFWRGAHTREPYYRKDFSYDDYAPAYRTGYEAAARYRGQNRRFDDLDSALRSEYESTKGKSRLAWDDAKDAARAAWDRVERALPGDFDKDGR